MSKSTFRLNGISAGGNHKPVLAAHWQRQASIRERGEQY